MGDFIGPRLPNKSPSSGRSIGPLLPPGWRKSSDKEEKDDSQGCSIGPTFPPNWKKNPAESLEEGKGDKSEIDDSVSGKDEDEDEDEDEEENEHEIIGPLPPTPSLLVIDENRHTSGCLAKGKASQREEWMTTIPENSSIAQKLGFGKNITTFSAKPVPAEEMNPEESAKDKTIRESVEKYHAKKRSQPGTEQKGEKKKQKKDQEKPKRELFSFDPEKDLKRIHIDPEKTKSIFKNAELLNDRFYSGSKKY